MSSKNYMLSTAAADLGLGDQLAQQMQDETEEMKRRRLMENGKTPGGMMGQGVMSPAAFDLGLR